MAEKFNLEAFGRKLHNLRYALNELLLLVDQYEQDVLPPTIVRACPDCSGSATLIKGRVSGEPIPLQYYSGNCDKCSKRIVVQFALNKPAPEETKAFNTQCYRCHKSVRVGHVPDMDYDNKEHYVGTCEFCRETQTYVVNTSRQKVVDGQLIQLATSPHDHVQLVFNAMNVAYGDCANCLTTFAFKTVDRNQNYIDTCPHCGITQYLRSPGE